MSTSPLDTSNSRPVSNFTPSVFNAKRLPRVAGAGIVILLLAYFLRSSIAAAKSKPLVRTAISSVRSSGGITGRTMLSLSSGPCVILHYPPTTTPNFSLEGFSPVDNDLNRSPNDVIFAYGETSTFNCVTFALGNLVNLQPTDWIEPLPRLDTFYTVPAQVILDSYCSPVASYSVGGVSTEDLGSSKELQPYDIVCYRQNIAGSSPIVHMGRVVKRGARNSLVSKLGTGPIVESTIQLCAERFVADSIEIYRPKNL